MLSLVAPWLINLAQLGAIALILVSRSWFLLVVLSLAKYKLLRFLKRCKIFSKLKSILEIRKFHEQIRLFLKNKQSPI